MSHNRDHGPYPGRHSGIHIPAKKPSRDVISKVGLFLKKPAGHYRALNITTRPEEKTEAGRRRWEGYISYRTKENQKKGCKSISISSKEPGKNRHSQAVHD